MRLAIAAVLLAFVAPLGGRARPSAIASADARLNPGAHKTLLQLHGLGRWTASCDHGRVGVTFSADRLLPTSDLVVTRTQGAPLARRLDPGDTVDPEPRAPVLAERWQIAPFAAAQVQVATASVAGRAAGNQCSASVLVATGPDQGPTITG